MIQSDRPLVSLVVFAYKQEKYIRQAVESALAQSYSPLEIILSDDASPDSTFEVMSEVVSAYDGPHLIRLNRNNANLGIGGHLNKVLSLVSSEFVIMQAGDDVSIPTRVDKLVGAWLVSGKKAHYIHSDVRVMDQSGVLYDVRKPGLAHKLNNIQTMVHGNPHAIGASEAFSVELFQKFGPLGERVIHEDCVLPFRAALLGRCCYVEEPLLYYRDGGISSSYKNRKSVSEFFEQEAVVAERYAEDFKQKLRDFLVVSSDPETERIFRKKIAEWELVSRMSSGRRTGVREIIRFLKSGNDLAFAVKQIIKYSFPKAYLMFLNYRKNG